MECEGQGLGMNVFLHSFIVSRSKGWQLHCRVVETWRWESLLYLPKRIVLSPRGSNLHKILFMGRLVQLY